MTNESKNTDAKGKESILSALKLLIVVVLAFVAALTFRRSAGIIAMTPIALTMCALAAFIGVSPMIKCTVFGITVFSVNTIENNDMSITLLFAALCLLAVAVLSYAARAIKNKKKRGYATFATGILVCLVLNLLFVGNPFAAISAKKKISDYTGKKYPQSENGILGDFEFSNIYYRYDTKAYVVDAVSNKYPTEGASITLGNEVIRDGFSDLMAQKLSEPYVLEIKDILRKKFPNDSFSAEFDGVASLPDETVFSASDGELKNRIYYEITLGGVQTAEQMRERIRQYVNALDESGIGYAKLTFKSGIGTWQRRYVSIDPNHIIYHAEFDIKYVSTGNSNRFNEYLSKMLFG